MFYTFFRFSLLSSPFILTFSDKVLIFLFLLTSQFKKLSRKILNLLEINTDWTIERRRHDWISQNTELLLFLDDMLHNFMFLLFSHSLFRLPCMKCYETLCIYMLRLRRKIFLNCLHSFSQKGTSLTHYQ